VYDIVSWADGIALIKNDAQISIQFRLFHFHALRVYALLLWFSISSRYPGGDNFIPAEWRGGVWLAWFGTGRSAVLGSSQEGTIATSAGYRHRIAVSAVRDGKLGANSKRRPAVGTVCPACPWHKEALSQTLFHAISVQFTQRCLFKPSRSRGGSSSSSRQETRQVTRIPAWLA
jgi:hypothetical protein